MTTSDNDLFRERSGTLWNFLRLGEKFQNFTELYSGSDGMELLWQKLKNTFEEYFVGIVTSASARPLPRPRL